MFSAEEIRFESSYNTSIKIIYDLPLNSHRCLIEPITEARHVRIILFRRFLSFIQQIMKSPKQLPKQMLKLIQTDTRSTTGNNLRKILLQTTKFHVSQLNLKDVDEIKYHPIKEHEKWKIGLCMEILSVRKDELIVDGFTDLELEEILFHLCSD